MPELSVAEIASLAAGRVLGDPSTRIRGAAPVESAGPEHLTFVANARYLPYLQGTRAGAVLVAAALADEVPERLTRVVVEDAHVALFRVLSALHPATDPRPGIHSTAVVDPAAELGKDLEIGPYAVIGRECRVGDRTRIGAHSVLGDGVGVGSDCIVHSHVTLYAGTRVGDRCVIHSGARIGREGFGFVWADGGHRRVPQVGGCILGDEVEVGANVVIDRGSIDDTLVGSGTKLDNLIHVGHNVKIGRHVILTAQVGIAGSASIGDGAMLGGQAGVGGHLSVGARANIAGQAGVIGDVPPGQTYSGYPARPHKEAMRALGALFRLPELVRRVRELEKAVQGRRADD